MSRSSWDKYFMGIAKMVATRATCDRKHVGAVVVKDNRILATGYNGSGPKLAHCDDVGHLMVDGHCVRTIHAEANALAQAARSGVAVEGASIYVTAFPCWNCFKLLLNAGVRDIYYNEKYRPNPIIDQALEEYANQFLQLSSLWVNLTQVEIDDE